MAETADEFQTRAARIHEEKQRAAALNAEEKQARSLGIPGKAGDIITHLLPDEPVFVLRGKDILSTMVLMNYASLIDTYVPYGGMAESMRTILDDFRTWQVANPQSVKLPD